MYSGFTNNAVNNVKDTDVPKVLGNNPNISRYLSGSGWNASYGTNAIDPAVFYDESGNLWMVYGSWFGGIFMLELDEKTGLRDYNVKYETKANVSDAYMGIKAAGGDFSSGEGPYIEYMVDPNTGKGYYYTHSNKAVLDSITQADKAAIDSLPQFKDGVEADIQELRESVSTVVEQAHWHHNLTVLNSITAAKVAKWDRDIDLSVYATKDYADGLSTQWNDRLTYEIQELDARFILLENKAHTHGNSAVLDALTAAQVSAWVNRSELGNFATNAALTYGLDTLRRELTEVDEGLDFRVSAIESELEGIETILRRVVG